MDYHRDGKGTSLIQRPMPFKTASKHGSTRTFQRKGHQNDVFIPWSYQKWLKRFGWNFPKNVQAEAGLQHRTFQLKSWKSGKVISSWKQGLVMRSVRPCLHRLSSSTTCRSFSSAVGYCSNCCGYTFPTLWSTFRLLPGVQFFYIGELEKTNFVWP